MDSEAFKAMKSCEAVITHDVVIKKLFMDIAEKAKATSETAKKDKSVEDWS